MWNRVFHRPPGDDAAHWQECLVVVAVSFLRVPGSLIGWLLIQTAGLSSPPSPWELRFDCIVMECKDFLGKCVPRLPYVSTEGTDLKQCCSLFSRAVCPASHEGTEWPQQLLPGFSYAALLQLQALESSSLLLPAEVLLPCLLVIRFSSNYQGYGQH